MGLSAPVRLDNVAAACNWSKASTWTFEPLDDEAFPAVNLARRALGSCEPMTAVFNAANEQAVRAFLNHQLPYLDIVKTIRSVMDAMETHLPGTFTSVEVMEQVEHEARQRADALIDMTA